MTTDAYPTPDEIADDLKIIKTTRRAAGAGTWVIGTTCGHKFNALVFPAPAENPDYEIEGSRISKLWIQRLSDKAIVYNFDRGIDVKATTLAAARILGFLAAGLAEHVYGK